MDVSDNLTQATNGSVLPMDCSSNFFRSETNLAMLLTLFENAVALVVLFKVKVKGNNTHFLIKMMATNDFCSALGILVSSLSVTLFCGEFVDSVICRLIGWLAMSSFCWSLHIVAVINIERYLMTCRPILHRNHCSRKRLLLLCLAGLVLVYLILGLPLLGVGTPYTFYRKNKFCAFSLGAGRSGQQRWLVGVCAGLGLVWVITTVVCSVSITRNMARRNAASVDAKKTQTDNPKHSVLCCKILSYEKDNPMMRFALVTSVIALVNCLMNLPFYTNIVVGLALYKESFDHMEDVITSVLWICTATINPVIYIACNKLYKQQFMRPFRKCGKVGSEKETSTIVQEITDSN